MFTLGDVCDLFELLVLVAEGVSLGRLVDDLEVGEEVLLIVDATPLVL